MSLYSLAYQFWTQPDHVTAALPTYRWPRTQSALGQYQVDIRLAVWRLCDANRPIVLLRLGHEVRGIPAGWSSKKHCFQCSTEALSWPGVALNDCFFFSACLKDTVDVWWCARPMLALEKVRIWATFTLARVAESLAIAPGQLYWPELRTGDIQEEQSISRWRKNATLNNKMREWSDERLSSSASPPGVPFEADSVNVDGWPLMFRHWAIARTTTVDPRKNKAHHQQNRQRNQSLDHLHIFLLSSFFKKNDCVWWAASEQARDLRAELIAARRWSWSTSVLLLRAEQLSSWKLSVLPSFRLF